jgi:hypothetical protein
MLQFVFLARSVMMSGCRREEQGPLLAGGREVGSWVAALNDAKPQVRRQAVLKLGNVGDADSHRRANKSTSENRNQK